MKTVGIRELRENTEEYIKKVEKGQEFLVMRRSKPVFKIIPVDEWGDEGVWRTLVDFTKIRKGGVPVDKVSRALKELIKEDRRGQSKKISTKVNTKRKTAGRRTSR